MKTQLCHVCLINSNALTSRIVFHCCCPQFIPAHISKDYTEKQRIHISTLSKSILIQLKFLALLYCNICFLELDLDWRFCPLLPLFPLLLFVKTCLISVLLYCAHFNSATKLSNVSSLLGMLLVNSSLIFSKFSNGFPSDDIAMFITSVLKQIIRKIINLLSIHREAFANLISLCFSTLSVSNHKAWFPKSVKGRIRVFRALKSAA